MLSRCRIRKDFRSFAGCLLDKRSHNDGETLGNKRMTTETQNKQQSSVEKVQELLKLMIDENKIRGNEHKNKINDVTATGRNKAVDKDDNTPENKPKVMESQNKVKLSIENVQELLKSMIKETGSRKSEYINEITTCPGEKQMQNDVNVIEHKMKSGKFDHIIKKATCIDSQALCGDLKQMETENLSRIMVGKNQTSTKLSELGGDSQGGKEICGDRSINLPFLKTYKKANQTRYMQRRIYEFKKQNIEDRKKIINMKTLFDLR